MRVAAKVEPKERLPIGTNLGKPLPLDPNVEVEGTQPNEQKGHCETHPQRDISDSEDEFDSMWDNSFEQELDEQSAVEAKADPFLSAEHAAAHATCQDRRHLSKSPTVGTAAIGALE